MNEMEPGWPALAEAVKQRRARLGLNQEDIPTRGGPSSSTVRKIEAAAADKYQARIMFQLDEALAWGKGTSQEIVEGPRSWMGSFEDFLSEVIKDTRDAERRGDDYPVGWRAESREGPDITFSSVDGTPFRFLEAKLHPGLSSASDEELLTELAARLKRRSNAQGQEPQQSTRGPAGGSPSGGGTPITTGHPDQDALLRRAAGLPDDDARNG